MAQKMERLMSIVTAIAAGAIVGGLAGWALAPPVFWALMLGGALIAGALRVGYLLFMADDNGSAGR